MALEVLPEINDQVTSIAELYSRVYLTSPPQQGRTEGNEAACDTVGDSASCAPEHTDDDGVAAELAAIKSNLDGVYTRISTRQQELLDALGQVRIEINRILDLTGDDPDYPSLGGDEMPLKLRVSNAKTSLSFLQRVEEARRIEKQALVQEALELSAELNDESPVEQDASVFRPQAFARNAHPLSKQIIEFWREQVALLRKRSESELEELSEELARAAEIWQRLEHHPDVTTQEDAAFLFLCKRLLQADSPSLEYLECVLTPTPQMTANKSTRDLARAAVRKTHEMLHAFLAEAKSLHRNLERTRQELEFAENFVVDFDEEELHADRVSRRTLEKLRDQLNQIRIVQRERFAALVDQRRTEIPHIQLVSRLKSLWTEQQRGDAELEKFLEQDFYSAEGMSALRSKVEELETRSRQQKEIRELTKQRHEFIERIIAFEHSASDPSRLFQSSFRLLQEEKWRKTCVPTLLRMEDKLRGLLISYQKTFGEHILEEGGKSLLERLDREIAERFVNETVIDFSAGGAAMGTTGSNGSSAGNEKGLGGMVGAGSFPAPARGRLGTPSQGRRKVDSASKRTGDR